MEFHVPRGFTCNHGLTISIVLFIALLAFLLRPTVAVKMSAGLPKALENEDSDEIGDMIAAMVNGITSEIDEEDDYEPGVVAQSTFTFTSGLRMLFRLINWNTYTCNVGLGSEALSPVVLTPGADISRITGETLLPLLETLIIRDFGEGKVLEQGLSLDYFPDSDNEAELPSDDDSTDHEDGDDNGGEEGVGNLDAAAGLTPLDGFFRRNHSQYLAANSTTARKGRPLNSNGTAGSDVYVNHTLVENQNSVPTGANSTNLTRLGHRKFPVDPNGDCDISSVILMTARSSFYYDDNVHGLPLLNPTDKIWSPNTRFYLVMQVDCNLVLYDSSTNAPLWESFTDGEGTGCFAALTMTGTLAVFDGNSNLLFRTQTACLGKKFPGLKCWTNALLQVQDDGNLVLYIFNTKYPLFASNTVQCEGGCTV